MQNSGLPPLNWLRAFEATARHLSFTRAAGELNLTQSAVSQHVRSLESFLGRDLFVRKTRALELTEVGANYLPGLRDAFDLIATSTRACVGGDRGRNMTIQCNMAFSVFWLAPRLHRLYAACPWLVLNIVTPIWDPERNAANASVEIRFGRGDDMSRAAVRLAEERFYPVCSPGYQSGDVDLNSATLLDCAGVSGTWGNWFKMQGVEFGRENDVNLTSTFVIAITAALNGAGMSMAHDSLVSDLLEKGDLVRPFEFRGQLNEGYYLLSPSAHARTPASDAFLDWMEMESSTADQMPAAAV